jgi:hypothetical protein
MGVGSQRHAPEKGPPSTHCTVGWVGPRAGLDTEARGKILSPLPGNEPRSPGRPARSQTLYWLSYPAHKRSCHHTNFNCSIWHWLVSFVSRNRLGMLRHARTRSAVAASSGPGTASKISRDWLPRLVSPEIKTELSRNKERANEECTYLSVACDFRLHPHGFAHQPFKTGARLNDI